MSKPCLFAFAFFAVLSVVSCGKKNIEADLQQEIETLERKTTPPDATIIARSAPVRTDWGVTASWDIETTMGKPDYSDWLKSKLQPEFNIATADSSHLVFTRRDDNDIYAVDFQFAPTQDRLHIHVHFSAHPD